MCVLCGTVSKKYKKCRRPLLEIGGSLTTSRFSAQFWPACFFAGNFRGRLFDRGEIPLSPPSFVQSTKMTDEDDCDERGAERAKHAKRSLCSKQSYKDLHLPTDHRPPTIPYSHFLHSIEPLLEPYLPYYTTLRIPPFKT